MHPLKESVPNRLHSCYRQKKKKESFCSLVIDVNSSVSKQAERVEDITEEAPDSLEAFMEGIKEDMKVSWQIVHNA